MEKMEAMREHFNCATIFELFCKLGVKTNTKRAKINTDHGAYKLAASNGTLDSYSPPGYLLGGLRQVQAAQKEQTKQERPRRQERRRGYVRHAPSSHGISA